MQTLLKASNHQGALSLFPWCCRIVLPYVFFPLTGRVHCESTPYPSPPPNHPPMVYSSHTVHTMDVTSPHVVAYSLSHPNSWSTCNALSDPPQRGCSMQCSYCPSPCGYADRPGPFAFHSMEYAQSDRQSVNINRKQLLRQTFCWYNSNPPYIYRCLMFIWNM